MSATEEQKKAMLECAVLVTALAKDDDHLFEDDRPPAGPTYTTSFEQRGQEVQVTLNSSPEEQVIDDDKIAPYHYMVKKGGLPLVYGDVRGRGSEVLDGLRTAVSALRLEVEGRGMDHIHILGVAAGIKPTDLDELQGRRQ